MNIALYLTIAFAVMLCIIVIILAARYSKTGRYSYMKINILSHTSIGLIGGGTLVVLVMQSPEVSISFGESLFLLLFLSILGFLSGYGNAKAREVVQRELKKKK